MSEFALHATCYAPRNQIGNFTKKPGNILWFHQHTAVGPSFGGRYGKQ